MKIVASFAALFILFTLFVFSAPQSTSPYQEVKAQAE
jgi:hypothetical protein